MGSPPQPKFSYSAFCRKSRKSKRYAEEVKKEKDEFAINGWETPELAQTEDEIGH